MRLVWALVGVGLWGGRFNIDGLSWGWGWRWRDGRELGRGLGRRALAAAGLLEIVGDGVLPGVVAKGGDVLILGEMEGLDERLAEKGKSGGGFGFDLALGDGGEKTAQGETQVSGGHVVAGEEKGDVLAGSLAGKGLRFFAGVEGAEIRMAVAARKAALAAIGERESTQGRAVLGVICRHRILQKERFEIFGGTSRKRGALLNKKSVPE